MNQYKKHAGKFFLVLSKIAVLLAAVDYLNIIDAPFQLGANSWLLIAIILGVYSVTANQMKSDKDSAQT